MLHFQVVIFTLAHLLFSKTQISYPANSVIFRECILALPRATESFASRLIIELRLLSVQQKSLLNPTNPYAATKAGAEFIARSYFYSFNMPIIITRGNNVYGPRQYPEKLIPKFINQLINNEKCTIHGKGETRRNFIYVDDVVKAIEIILQKGIINNIYNIGTNNEYSVSEIADKLIKYLKPNDKVEDWTQNVTDRNFNDYRYAIKSNELYDLGWKEETNFEKGFEYTIQWFQSNNKFNNIL